MPFNTSFATGDTVTSTDLNTIAGAWDTYTPTISGTGWALGNGTISGRWKKIGRLIVARVEIVFGTTSTYGTGALAVSLPTTAAWIGTPGGQGIAIDTGTETFPLVINIGVNFEPQCINASTTYGNFDNVTSTTPHTWANTDVIRFTAMYESST